MGAASSLQQRFKDPSLAYRFTESDVIGRGRYSTVFKANLIDFNRKAMDQVTPIPETVAIKVVSKNSTGAYELSRVVEEAKFLSKFKNPYAVTLYEYFETSTEFYMVMEYLGGRNLYQRVRACGKLSEEEAASITGQLAYLINAMAAGGYAHRDIRGDNVLFVDNDSTVIRVINFDNLVTTKKAKLSKHLSVRGSAYCVAPEGLTSGSDAQADVWAIGVLLFFILSGSFPFQCVELKTQHRQSFSECMNDGKKGGTLVNFIGESWQTISDDAKLLISRILVINPEKRLTARDILYDPWFHKYSLSSDKEESPLEDDDDDDDDACCTENDIASGEDRERSIMGASVSTETLLVC